MKWLKTLWNKLVTKTSISATVVEVEVEDLEPSDVGRVFKEICVQSRVRSRDLKEHNIVSIFEEWYDGPLNEERIRQSIPVFMEEHGGIINAKLIKLKVRK